MMEWRNGATQNDYSHKVLAVLIHFDANLFVCYSHNAENVKDCGGGGFCKPERDGFWFLVFFLFLGYQLINIYAAIIISAGL